MVVVAAIVGERDSTSKCCLAGVGAARCHPRHHRGTSRRELAPATPGLTRCLSACAGLVLLVTLIPHGDKPSAGAGGGSPHAAGKVLVEFYSEAL